MSSLLKSPLHPDSNINEGHDEGPSRERWLVSYADFITLLFAFFVVLFAASNQNLEKLREFQESVRKNLGLTGLILGAGSGVSGGGAGATGGEATGSGTTIPARPAPISTGLPTLRADPKEIEEALLELLQKHTGQRSSPFLGVIRQATDSSGRLGLAVILNPSLFVGGHGPRGASLRLNPEASGTLLALGEWVKKLDLQARLSAVGQDLDSQQLARTQESLNLLGRYFLQVHQWGDRLEAIEWSGQNKKEPSTHLFVLIN